MPDKNRFLRRADMQVWSRFLSSEEGQRGMNYLRLACPRLKEDTDASLIRNAVGHEFWHRCVDAMEDLGVVPEKQAPEPNESLEP